MKPARIRTATLLHFSLQPSDDPARQKVPNFVCYNRCTTLGGSDTAAIQCGDTSVRWPLALCASDVLLPCHYKSGRANERNAKGYGRLSAAINL
ncbi:hypothetical protein GQ600_16654 [Phytophthora cactorum]|nr:hypothetical protein GQ600_16654 [Phytophthora cactorum]